MMHLVFREREMVRRFYTYKAEIDSITLILIRIRQSQKRRM